MVVTKVLGADVLPIDSAWTRAFPALETIIRRAMERSVDARYQSAAEMRGELEAFLERSRAAIAAMQRAVDEEARQFAAAATARREVAPLDAPVDDNATIVWPPPDAPSAASATIDASAFDRVDADPVAEAAGSPADTPPPSRRGLIYATVAAALFLAALATPGLRRSGQQPRRSLEPAARAAAKPEDAPPREPTVATTAADPVEAATPRATSLSTPTAARTPTPVSDEAAKPSRTRPAAASSAVAPASPRSVVPPSPSATAKELFYAPAKKAANSAGVKSATTAVAAGLRYRLVSQLASGQEAEVVPATTFKSADKVRFAFESNLDGYLYVIEEGSSGQWHVLFPNPQINGGTNFIRRRQSYPVPSSAWFVFDEQPGTERLFVLLSKEPMREFPGLNQTVTQEASVDPSVVQRVSREMKSRDLIFQSDAAPQQGDASGSAAPAVYVVNRDKLAKEVATTIELVHK